MVLVTMDGGRREIVNGGMYAVDGFITEVGESAALPSTADEILDLSGHVVIPGLINTHHHFFQTLTRAVPEAQNAGLFDWLRALYPMWARLTPDHVASATKVALAELALSGCTTSSDHQYIFPNGSRLDDQFEAASEIGLRFHGARGSMSLGESDGGLPPDEVCEDERSILTDTERLIGAYHDPSPGSMRQVVVAPCSPFSVTPELMRNAAEQARRHGVSLHTHVAETRDEETYCLERFGMRPVELMESLGWMGDDVWFAHAVHLDRSEIGRMAALGTGVAHCPTSNMRLASGIAPIAAYQAAGIRVGLGVDGSASNDGNHLLAEVRQAMLLARVGSTDRGPLLTARQSLEMATIGSAAIVGRTDIGSITPGACADFVAVSMTDLRFAGALHDPVAALLFAAPGPADHVYVHGRAVVSDRELVDVELGKLVEDHNRLAAEISR